MRPIRLTVSPGRALDDAEGAASVLLAIAFAHALHATHVSWAAFAGYAVMRGHAADTLVRGTLRVLGTLAGGALALAAAPVVAASMPAAAVGQLIVGTASLYASLTGKRAYAWLFLGLTFSMVLIDKLERPVTPMIGFVTTRGVETLVGTVACVLVSLATTATLRRKWPAARAAAAQRIGWHPGAARHALQGGVAVALLTVASTVLPIPSPSQGATTIMAAMLVPAAAIGRGGGPHATRRVAQRLAGCLAGAAFALLVLLTTGGRPALMLLGVTLGVMIGRHIENGEHPHRYVGTQFAFAVLVALVPDDFARATIGPGMQRLAGILAGAVALQAVLTAWRLAAGRRSGAGAGGGRIDPKGVPESE